MPGIPNFQWSESPGLPVSILLGTGLAGEAVIAGGRYLGKHLLGELGNQAVTTGRHAITRAGNFLRTKIGGTQNNGLPDGDIDYDDDYDDDDDESVMGEGISHFVHRGLPRAAQAAAKRPAAKQTRIPKARGGRAKKRKR